MQAVHIRYSSRAERLRLGTRLVAAVTVLACACFSSAVRAEGSEPPDIPRLQIEASWQKGRENESSYRYRIQYLGETIAERPGASETANAGDGDGGGSTANPHALAVAAGGTAGLSSHSSNPGENDYPDNGPAVRIKYDWSDQAAGPDLFRVHVGDDVWTRPLGLDRYLGDAVGTIEMNATHDLDALNLSVGLQHALPGWRPSEAWGHYSLLGIDLERASPADAISTIHGNATVEAFWGVGFGQTEVDTVDEPRALREAVAAVTRGGTCSVDELTRELDATYALLLAVLSAFDLEDLDVAESEGPEQDYWTTLHSSILKEEWESPDYDRLYTAISEGHHVDPGSGITDSGALEGQLRIQSPGDHSWWDLLAVLRPNVGHIHTSVLECLSADDCEAFDRHLADSFRSALHNIEVKFIIEESGEDEKHEIKNLALEAGSGRLESGVDLANLLSHEAVRYSGRSVYRGIFSLEAIGWYPIGGSEPSELRGTLEPRLTWRSDANSNLSIAVTYKYGYERSTRDTKVNEWFVGLNYQAM